MYKKDKAHQICLVLKFKKIGKAHLKIPRHKNFSDVLTINLF